MPKKKKPAPISMALHKKPPTREVVPPTSEVKPFNDVSSITAKQMARAERGIEALRKEVVELRKRPQPAAAAPAPAPVVNIPGRPRIAKVVIKYDQLGFPNELIPQYTDTV
jgi:hypothetical protein